MVNTPNQDGLGFHRFGGDELVEELGDLAQLPAILREGQRYILGVVGPPMSDARELTDEVVRFLNGLSFDGDLAIAVHFDWWRKPGIQVKRLGNGGGTNVRVPYWSSASHESASFCRFLADIVNQPYGVHSASTFEHTTEVTVEEGLIVTPLHKIVVVQCPFLLSQAPPWASIKADGLIARTWFVDTGEDLLSARFYDFYRTMGLFHGDAQMLIQTDDLPTVRQVVADKERADVILRPSGG
jgi:hypothetical protein